MDFLKNISVRGKQTFVIMLTSAIALLLACTAFVVYDAVTFRKDLVNEAGMLAQVVGDNCAAAIDFDDPRAAAEILSSLRADPSIIAAALYDADGQFFAVYQRTEQDPSPGLLPAGKSHRFAGSELTLARTIQRQNQTVGTIVVAADLNTLFYRLFRYLEISAIVLILSLFVTWVLSRYLQGMISGPVLQLAQLTRTVAQEKDYSVRAGTDRRDEFGELMRGFDEMLEQIQQRDRALREARDELEARVMERTAALQEAKDAAAREYARFKFIFDAVPVGISWGIPGKRGMLVNPAHARITGVPAEKVDEPGIFERVSHPDDYRRQQELAAKHDKLEIDHYSLEKRYLHPDGRVVSTQFTSRRLPDPMTGEMQRVVTLVDISANKEAEAKLQRTEELYRRAIWGAGAVPYSLDYKTKAYIFLGEGIKDLIGYPAEEVNGQLWRRITQETVMMGEAGGLDKESASVAVLKGGIRTWRCDMRVRTREGRMRWISDVSVQNVDDAGNVTGSMGILEDITERKQAEINSGIYSKMAQNLAASSSAEEAARVVGQVADELLQWDCYGVSLYSEETDTEVGILNLDLIDGKRVECALMPERRPPALARRVITEGAQLILRTGDEKDFPEVQPFGDVARRSASLMFAPIRFGSRCLGLLTIQSYTFSAYTKKDLRTLQDLADRCAGAMERIRVDEARSRSESQFRTIWNSSADGMRLLDENGIIQGVNPAFCKLVEMSEEELVGHPLTVIHSEARRDFVSSKFRARFHARKIPERREEELELWNGRKVWFEFANSWLELPGEVPMILTIFRDNTLRKTAEARLAALHQQLLETSRQAGMAEIATSVLHNVGNVLNSVNVSANLVDDTVRQSRISSLSKVVALLEENASDLGTFIVSDRGRQLVDFLAKLSEHLEAERKTVTEEVESLRGNIDHIKHIVTMQQNYARVAGVKELLSPVELVEDSLRLNAGSLSRHGIKVVRDFKPVSRLQVEKHKVLQVLVNLIRNAKHACDDSGRSDKEVRLEIKQEEDRIHIQVSDNGVGIPQEIQTKIFSHGFTTRRQGHGFGLHSSALAAREMGGSLTVHSDGTGKGASFTLTIPAGEKKKGTAMPKKGAVQSLTPSTPEMPL